MPFRCLFFSIISLVVSLSVNAQSQLKGKIYFALSDSAISSVTVYNKNLNVRTMSAIDGSYSIQAQVGNLIFFSISGFIPDTVKVEFSMLLTPYNVNLEKQIITLETATVISSYSADSLQRRIEYQKIFAKQPGITGFNAPEKGFGVVFSPLSFFSKEARQKRVLKKRLLKQEQEDYIDRIFSVEWVAKLTGLKDDSLRLFIYGYRPGYKFCRKADRQAMLLYISDKLKEFRKPGKEQKDE